MELMFAIESMDRVLRFGYAEMKSYDRRICDDRKLDFLVRSMERWTMSNNVLLAKVMIIASVQFLLHPRVKGRIYVTHLVPCSVENRHLVYLAISRARFRIITRSS